MKNEIGLNVLKQIQCMYQQKIISRNDKTEIANLILKAMKEKDYSLVENKLNNTKCLIKGKEYWLEETLDIIKGGYK